MSNTDLVNLIQEIDTSLQKYIDKVSVDELIATMIGFCKILAETKGLKKKEFRRGLKAIIDKQLG